MPIPAPSASSRLPLQIGTKRVNSNSQGQLPQPSIQDGQTETESSEVAPRAARPSLGRPLSLQRDVEGSKRRSMLPQLGQPRYNTRSSMLPDTLQRSNEDSEPAQDTTEPSEPSIIALKRTEATVQSTMKERLRPKSMYEIDAIPSEPSKKHDETSTSQMMRPVAPVSKLSESRIAGLVRSHSSRKAGITTQAAQPIESSDSSQAQSTKSTAITRKDSSKLAAASDKPKSLLAPPSSNFKAHSIPTNKEPSGTRTSARLMSLNRPASANVEHEASNGRGSTAMASKAENLRLSKPKRQESTREDGKKTGRPAFSTLQQHFTPRKVGKAPTATFLHPPPASGTNSLPSEMASLQSQLLQLHLLHEVSAQVNGDWEASAKDSLHKKFENVSRLHQTMVEYEARGNEQKSLQALLEWSARGASTGFIEHLQSLSELLHEIPSLIEPGGRMHRLVGDFEGWIRKVQEVRCVGRDSIRHGGSRGPIEGLGDSWKAENSALVRKLNVYGRDLNSLDGISAESSIAYMVETCQRLLRGILDELQVMQMIEEKVATAEKQWTEERLNAIAEDIGVYTAENGPDTAVWRS